MPTVLPLSHRLSQRPGATGRAVVMLRKTGAAHRLCIRFLKHCIQRQLLALTFTVSPRSIDHLSA